MSLRWQLSHGPGAQRDVSARVRANTTSVRTNAEEGSVAMSTVTVDDPTGDLEVGGLGGFYGFETESPTNETCFFRGFVADREISRGEDTKSFRTTTARQYVVQMADQNSILSRRIMLGSDANRPAETDVQRVRYLKGTPEMGHLDDDTYINLSGGVAMDACDYRGQTAFDVLNDCAQASGKNFWVMFIESGGRGGGTFGLWYDFVGSTAYSSDIRISNVASDVDETDAKIAAGTVTTFAASFDTKLVRDPHRVYSGVYMPYDGGAVYQQKTATGSNFQYRDTTAYAPNVKTAAKATARAIRYLNTIDTEEDRITTTIKVPNAQVNDLREGHRVECKFSHLPGYTDWSWMRVLNRTVTQVSEYFYQVTVEMSAEPTPTTAPLACSTALSGLAASLSDSGQGDGGPYGYTPDTPSSYPAVVLGAWAGINTFTFLTSATGSGSGNVSSPYTLLDEYTGNDEHTAMVVGYQALTSGAPGSFIPSWSLGNAAEAWETLAIAIPTADTAPVQAGDQEVSGGTVTLPSPPTAGNLLVQVQVVANSAGNPPDVPVAGWTRVASVAANDGGVSDLQLIIDCRCVGVGESNVVEIMEPAFFHSTSLSEWTITGAVTATAEGSGSGAGPVAGGGDTPGGGSTGTPDDPGGLPGAGEGGQAGSGGMYTEGIYGPAIGLDTRSNFRVGQVDHSIVSYRFIASQSSAPTILRANMRGGIGYSGGDGGTIRAAIQADVAGYPSGIDLTSTTWNPGNPGGNWEDKGPHSFSTAYALSSNTTYHVVFTNTAGDSTTNFVSVNTVWDQSQTWPGQPAFTSDFKVLAYKVSLAGWEARTETPVFDLEYANGAHDGQAYFGQTGDYTEISDAKMVRERFTVSGPNRTINRAGFRVARQAGAGALTIQLEASDGTVLRSGTVAAASWTATGAAMSDGNPYGSEWGYVDFADYELVSGQTYRLRASAPAGTTYWMHDLYEQDVFDSYGNWGSRSFPDGLGERTTDGTNWNPIYAYAPNDAQCFMADV